MTFLEIFSKKHEYGKNLNIWHLSFYHLKQSLAIILMPIRILSKLLNLEKAKIYALFRRFTKMAKKSHTTILEQKIVTISERYVLFICNISFLILLRRH
jgi:hypothetical protein